MSSRRPASQQAPQRPSVSRPHSVSQTLGPMARDGRFGTVTFDTPQNDAQAWESAYREFARMKPHTEMRTAGIPTDGIPAGKEPVWVYPRIRHAGNEKPIPWSTKAHSEMSEDEKRRVYVSETHSMADKYSKQYRAARSELEQPDFAGIELGRILPTYKGVSKNDRTCWNRTASNVGAVVFGQRGPMRVVSGSKHALRERERNPEHFRSIKDKVDEKTQKLAEYTSAYNSDFVKAAVEYRPEYVKIEGSTVSGDAPQWMQVPGVKVNRINSLQLQTLLNTSASINKDAVDPGLLGLFQVQGHETPLEHPELKHLPRDQRKPFVRKDASDAEMRAAYDREVELRLRATRGFSRPSTARRSASVPPPTVPYLPNASAMHPRRGEVNYFAGTPGTLDQFHGTGVKGNPRNQTYAAVKDVRSVTYGHNHVPTNLHKFLHQPNSQKQPKGYLNGPTLHTRKGWV